MAKYCRKQCIAQALAAILSCLYFVCLKGSLASNVEKIQDKNFNVSIKIINGSINVTWKVSSQWKNTTVYFSSSLDDDINNSSYAANFSVCHAFKQGNASWKVGPVKGNLLEFCKKSRNCVPVEAQQDLLVKTSGSLQELSCVLFTSCTNFEDNFRIQVVSTGGGETYNFRSGNMTILSENIPPFYDVSDKVKYNYVVDASIGFPINYASPSKLCGFGSNPTETLHLVFEHYKVNKSKCFYLGQKTVPYSGKTVMVNFSDIIIRETDVIYFDYAVKSLASNKTTPSQLIKFVTFPTSATSCGMIGGVIKFSWRRQWSCFDHGTTERARFCFSDKSCYPLCEASFFANGTLRAARTYEEEVKKGCKSYSRCKLISERKDIKFIKVSWSPTTQTISCELYTTCMEDGFWVKAKSLNEAGAVVNDVTVCHHNIVHTNEPAVPHNISVVDVKSDEVTITWKSPKCEMISNLMGCHVCAYFGKDGCVQITDSSETDDDGLNYIFKHTQKNLLPYKNVTYQLKTKCGSKEQSAPLAIVTTKPSVPNGVPTSIRVTKEGSKGIRVSWQLPPDNYLNGRPNETKIAGRLNKTVVYRETVYGDMRTTYSFSIDGNESLRCAYYKVLFCNAPHLCSNYSKEGQLRECLENPTTPQNKRDPVSSTNNLSTILSSLITLIVIVVFTLIATYVWCQKKRKEMRPKLPELIPERDQKTGDYIPMGQLSHPGVVYASLDKEERLDELGT